jgi:NAD(P)H-hydrate repair Nnr-like enzyme with NAD(P)H-hydrate epimerase domain
VLVGRGNGGADAVADVVHVKHHLLNVQQHHNTDRKCGWQRALAYQQVLNMISCWLHPVVPVFVL